MSSTDGNIHLGTIGMGIPVIYREVVANIFSSHLAVESTFAKYLETHGLWKARTFVARMRLVVAHHPLLASDWAHVACKLLNEVRNKCVHIDGPEYQPLENRLQGPLDAFVEFVRSHNTRLDHKMTDFEWASTMVYQRLFEVLGLNYDDLELGRFSVLPAGLRQYFEVR